MPEKEARPPAPKSPRWSAERRARPAGRAPRLARCGSSRAETRDNRRLAPFGAPLAPRGGGWNRDKQNPKHDLLFESGMPLQKVFKGLQFLQYPFRVVQPVGREND